MFWVFNHIVIWHLSAKSGQCVTSLFVVLPIRIFSFSTNVYIFRNFSYRILRVFFFYTSLLRYAWNHGSAQVYIQIPICLSVECLCYLFINISFRKTNCLWSFFRRLRKNFRLCTLIVSSMSAYSVSEEFAIVTILSSGMSPPSP